MLKLFSEFYNSMHKFILSFFLLSSSILTFSQSTRVIQFNVNSTDQGKKAIVNWTMNAGSTCLDFVVERSNDNVNFREVYIFPGICGDSDNAVSYSWVDPNPIPLSTSYYRLKLDGVEFSLVAELNLSSRLNGKEIILFPNPSLGNFTVEFDNAKRKDYSISIFNLNGAKIFEENKESGNFHALSFPFLKSGIYYVNIKFKDSKTFSTKLILR